MTNQPARITLPLWTKILIFMQQNQPTYIKPIYRELGTCPSTANAITKTLEEKGLITRNNTVNNRTKTITLTEKGEQTTTNILHIKKMIEEKK